MLKEIKRPIFKTEIENYFLKKTKEKQAKVRN